MKEFLKFVKGILRTATLRDSSITFLGTILNALFGALFYIFIARLLGPSDFGIFGVIIAILTMTSDIGDLGTDTGLVNFVSRHIKSNKEKAERYLKLGLEFKVVIWLVVFLLGFIFSSFVANNLFHIPKLTPLLKIAFLGVGAMLLFSFIIHTLQAVEKFWSWSIIQVGTNALRFIAVLLFVYIGAVNISWLLWVYIIMPFIGFIIGISIIKPNFLTVKNEFSVAKEFFKYNGWVAAFTLTAAISSRLDLFISARLLDSTDVGLYSAATQMVKIVPQMVVAMGTVIAPKMASMENPEEMLKYFKKTQIMILMIALVGILSIPIVLFLIAPIFGSEYLAAGSIFIVLFFAMLVFLISVPVHMSIFYYFSYPKLFFWLSIINLTIVGVLGWTFVSSLGAIGAAWSVLIAQVVNFIIPLMWFVKKIKT